MVEEKFLHSEISSLILQAFYTVYNHFRFGYPNLVYQRSMLIEMRKLGLECKENQSVKLYYDAQEVGVFSADIVVNKRVAVNIETKDNISLEDELKIYYFVRTSQLEVGLFLNFGKTPYHKRKYYPNQPDVKSSD